MEIASDQRDFHCAHCHGRIVIPSSLPSTTGPCPHCGAIIISPAPPPPEPLPVRQRVAHDVVPVSGLVSPPVEKAVEAVEVEAARAVKAPRRSSRVLLMALGIVLLLMAGVGGVVMYMARQVGSHAAASPLFEPVDLVAAENQFLRSGWQVEASRVLRQFLAAENVRDKCKLVLGGDEVAPRMEAFYGGGRIDDSDTPAEAFSAYDLSMEDRKRGLFMMIYDRPPQYNMRDFFRPIATIEVQYGVEDADMLLGSFALASNFSMEPVRVPAFFKRTQKGLRLDWDSFVQAKYHTLRNFLDVPEGGRNGVFRLLVVEEMPEQGRSVAGTRRYRVADPSNVSDSARINVPIDSEVGRALSVINWRGVRNSAPKTRTVTLELAWEGDQTPELHVSKFLCWEFLGLGSEAAASR